MANLGVAPVETIESESKNVNLHGALMSTMMCESQLLRMDDDGNDYAAGVAPTYANSA